MILLVALLFQGLLVWLMSIFLCHDALTTENTTAIEAAVRIMGSNPLTHRQSRNSVPAN